MNKKDKIGNKSNVIEKKINEIPVPPVLFKKTVNAYFYKNRVYMRFALDKNADVSTFFGDCLQMGQYAVLDVTYYDVDFKKLEFSNSVNFYCCKILEFYEKNGLITIVFDDKGKTSVFEFTFKKYEWKIFKIIEEKDYLKYVDDVKNGVTYTVKTKNRTYNNVGTELARLPVPEFELKED